MQVGIRVFAGRQQIDAGVGAHRPVAVLARTVDAGKWLLVQQYAEMVSARYAFHYRHHEQVVVTRQVYLFVHRRKFKLVVCHFVVARFDGNAEF